MFTHIYYIIRSFLFCIKLLFKKYYFDIVFYYPRHFNRGVDGNYYINHILKSCDKHNISYILFEEPDFSSNKRRNDDAVCFDFIFIVIIILRKILNTKNIIKTDHQIGKILALSLFRNFYFNNYITLSQSMLSVFSGINLSAKLYDLQHGIIYNNKKDYIFNGYVADNISKNNVALLLTGSGFRNILLDNDKEKYFQKNSYVIGCNYNSLIKHDYCNNNILVTLQFTSDHSHIQNKKLFNEIKDYLLNSDADIMFYLRHHPRFNNEIDISELLIEKNINMAPDNIETCFSLCSIHMTTYSTTTFEAALLGIPTIFFSRIDSDFSKNFIENFSYPIDYNITDLYDNSLYQESSVIIQNWARKYYESFNELNFIKLIQ